MRQCKTIRCRAVDVATGIPSDYRPKFRPRRLVMPVDGWNMYDNKRAPNIARADEISKSITKREATKRGAIQLATVPRERSAADTFRVALDNCLANDLGSVDSLLSAEFKAAENLLLETRQILQEELGVHNSSDAPCATETNAFLERDLVSLGTSSERLSELAPHTNRTWELLEKTPMNSPAHGFLALRGKALVESVVLKLLYAQYPRLRSHHAQLFLAQCTGLLPTSRVATRLGMVDLFGVQLEVGLWREMSTLLDRVHTASRMAKIHKERLEVGHTAQRRWYWQSVLRSAARKLSSFHLEMNDIRPRMEWLRDQVFQWIGALESLEGNRAAVAHIERLFASQLAHFLRRQRILDGVESFLDSDAAKAVERIESNEETRHRAASQLIQLKQAFQKLVQKVKRDADMFGTDSVHPLDEKSRQRRESFNSQFGAHGVEGLKDDVRDVYRVEKMKLLAPPQIVHLIQPENAFKEAQIVLRYDPFVAPELRNAPIDVDQTVRKVVEVHETNKYNTLPGPDQLRTVEYTEVKLFAGNSCIGIGKGETDMSAINEASIHMLANYYLRKPMLNGTVVPEDESKNQGEDDQRPAVVETPVIRKSSEKSEYAF